MKREDRVIHKQMKKEIYQSLRKHAREFGCKVKGINLFFVYKNIFIKGLTGFTILNEKNHFFISYYAKPMILDEIFWELMDMPNNAKMPLSFRSNGAFTAPVFYLKEERFENVPVDIDIDEFVVGIIKNFSEEIKIIIDDILDKHGSFEEFVIASPSTNSSDRLKTVLCNLSLGRYKGALKLVGVDLEKGDPGDFINCDVGINERIYHYCQEKIKNLG